MRNLIISASILTTSCSSAHVNYVVFEDYQNIKKCWNDNYGNFVAFAVFARIDKDRVIPYFISYKCAELGDNGDPFYLIDKLSAVPLESSNKMFDLKQECRNFLKKNYASDSRIPKYNDKIYTLKGKIEQLDKGHYNLINISKMKYTGIEFQSFAKMNKKERFFLFKNNI